MNEFQPRIIKGRGHAPGGVCSRWMDDSPCGAAATHHVIWDYEMHNGCVCPAHADEARKLWVYVGFHPWAGACSAAGVPEWIESEDICVIPGSPAGAMTREMAAAP